VAHSVEVDAPPSAPAAHEPPAAQVSTSFASCSRSRTARTSRIDWTHEQGELLLGARGEVARAVAGRAAQLIEPLRLLLAQVELLEHDRAAVRVRAQRRFGKLARRTGAR
jgi:hypothetical protein